MYNLRLPDYLVQLIRGLHPDIKGRILWSLRTLVNDPYSGKRLKDEMEELRSFKVKRLRIIYRLVMQEEIQIVTIGPKEQIYEETYRLLLKEKEAD